MQLTAEQIDQIVRAIEALDYGEVRVLVHGPGRPLRVQVTHEIDLGQRYEEALDVVKEKA